VVIPKTRISKFGDGSNRENTYFREPRLLLGVASGFITTNKESINILRANIRSDVMVGPADSVGLILRNVCR
jgi:hypothetical protein